MKRQAFQIVLVLLLVVGFLAGVVALGRLSLEQLRSQKRYQLPLTEIECQPPPGMQPVEFLEQVQYYASLPTRIHLLEEGLPTLLAEAFRKHPYVERVQQVLIRPPQTIRVQLVYRVPVLAVRWGGKVRTVTAEGILLPPQAPHTGLPVYERTPSDPEGPAGVVWNDPRLLEAARKAGGR